MATASDASLTVVLVSTERLWQGGEEQAWQLSRGLRKRGHRCVIVARRNTPFARRLQQADFEVVTCGGKLPWPPRVWSLRRTLQRSRANVVYANDAHAILLGGLAAARLPGVVTVAARRVSFAIRSPTRYRRLCDRVFCVSTFVADQCAAAGIPADRLRVIHDGVDPARTAAGDRARGRRALGLGDHEVLVLSVGSLVPCKGHHDLLEALPAVRQVCPRVRCAIAGSGDREPSLRRQIDQLRLGDVVQLLGRRGDVPDLLHACDLFVFPSLAEGLGSTLIDAMLAQRPIVTTNAGGIPDLAGSSAPGRHDYAWVVEPASPEQLSQAMIDALQHPELCATMVTRAAQRAGTGLTHDAMVDATIRECRAALREK